MAQAQTGNKFIRFNHVKLKFISHHGIREIAVLSS